MNTTDTAREVVITIPMAPPAELSPNARRRGNVWAQRSATETLREAARYSASGHEACMYANGEPKYQRCTIHEHVIWPKSKGVLPDPDALPTYCKAALDGIVDAGIIAGDSAKHVASVTASQEKGTDAQGSIVVTIRETSNG